MLVSCLKIPERDLMGGGGNARWAVKQETTVKWRDEEG